MTSRKTLLVGIPVFLVGALAATFALSGQPTPLKTDVTTVGQCAQQGAFCTTNQDCGACGATCEDAGTQNSGTTMIRRCTYLPTPNPACGATYWDGPQCQCAVPQRWNPAKNECDSVCDYSAPPAGCRYEGGGTDPFTCDAKLTCDGPPPSPATYPYIPGEQVTCASCLAQGKAYACHDIHDPEHLYEQGFCSDTKIAFTPAHIMDTPDCTYCQAGPGVAWCPEDMQTCPGGFKMGRSGPDCSFAACPTERKFAVTFNNEPLQVGKKPTSMGVCAVDQNGKIDPTYRGYITVTFETGGPIGDQPFGYFYSIGQFDQGCHTFPGGYIKFVRPGLQKITVTSQAIRYAYGDTEGTPPTTTAVNVLAASTSPTPVGCPAGKVLCNGQCYTGNCCSNADCRDGQTCATDGQGSYCQGPTPTPSPTLWPVDPTPTPTAPVMCEYAAPPEGCTYVAGPTYDPATQCGLILQCPSIPPAPSIPPSCPRVVKGDVTGDGHVDSADLAKLIDFLLGRLPAL